MIVLLDALQARQSVLLVLTLSAVMLAGVKEEYLQAISLHDTSNRFKKIYPAAAESYHWKLKVRTKAFGGTDFITFFASDIDRPLEYPCAFSTALCDFSVAKHKHSPEKHETIVNAYLKRRVLFPTPSMYGNLMVCTAQRNFFWKRPFLEEGPIDERWKLPAITINGSYYCLQVSLGKASSSDESTQYEIPPSKSSSDCPLQSYSCSSPFSLEPITRVYDPQLEVHVWYMTRENYRDMYQGKTAKVIVPLLGTASYTLFLYGTLTKPHRPTCSVTLPSGNNVSVTIDDRRLNRLKYPVPAQHNSSGIYTLTCPVTHTNRIQRESHHVELIKSLNITFIKGPKIFLEGQEGYVKYFSANTTSSTILVRIYTASPLVSFEVSGLSQHKPATMFTSFVSNSPYEIVWLHSISVEQLDYQANGAYRITVINDDQEASTQQFTIHKAKGFCLRAFCSKRTHCYIVFLFIFCWCFLSALYGRQAGSSCCGCGCVG